MEYSLVLFKTNTEFREELKRRLCDTKLIFLGDNGENQPVTSDILAETEIVFGSPDIELLSQLQNLKWLQLSSAGSEKYIGLLKKGVFLTNASGAYGPAVSEYMTGVLFELNLRLHQYRDEQNRSEWKQRGHVKSIRGSTVLCVGLGDIGKHFASNMKALGAYVIGVTRSGGSIVPPCADELLDIGSLDEALPKADVVALCLPETSETKGLFGRSRISRIKRGAILINVGRGSVLDTEALCDALEEGAIGGAALDVTPIEPLPPDHRLWRIENAVITPHIAGGFNMPVTLERLHSICLENAFRYIQRIPLINLIDNESGFPIK